MAKKTEMRHEFPKLLKASDGKVMEWEIWVERQRDDTAIIFKRYGYQNGAKQIKKDHITDGKKKGTKAETTPFEQAVLEAEGVWKKQLNRKSYGLTVEESAGKRDIAPMLAYEIGKCKTIDWGNAFAQYKYDGHRCLVHCDPKGKVFLMSREHGSITTMPHVIDAFQGILKPGQIIDGELYRHGWSLNKIGSVIKSKSEDKGREELKLYVFDQVADVSFEERFKPLRDLVPRKHPAVRLAPTVRVANQADLAMVEHDALENLFEGAMLRHGRRGYQAGSRVKDVLKVKQFVEGNFKVVDAKPGRGDYANCAIFTCVTEAGHEFDVTAPGEMPEKRAYWTNYKQYLGKLLKVKYQKMTATEEPVPFIPTAKIFVDDEKLDNGE